MSNSFVTLVITHSTIPNFRVEKNFDLTLTINDLKNRLETLVGTSPQYQKLELQDPSSGTTNVIEDGAKTLADCGFQNLQILHVVDTDPSNYVLSTQVGEAPAPFVLSAEKEAARAEVMKAAKEQKTLADDSRSLRVKVDDRCMVMGPAGSTEAPRIGTVAYIGDVSWAAGIWVGVKFDEALGKNDGSVKGTRYFQCEPNHGSFVKPASVVPLSTINAPSAPLESLHDHVHGHKCGNC